MSHRDQFLLITELIESKSYICPFCGANIPMTWDMRGEYRELILVHPPNPGMVCSERKFALPKVKVEEIISEHTPYLREKEQK